MKKILCGIILIIILANYNGTYEFLEARTQNLKNARIYIQLITEKIESWNEETELETVK